MTTKTHTIEALRCICLVVAIAGSFWTAQGRAWTGEIARGSSSDVSIAARVNGEPVTRAEVQQLLANPRERQQLLGESGAKDRNGEELDRLALGKLIDRRLVLQEARRRNWTVAEKDLGRAVTGLRRRFEDLKSLGVWMKEQGLDEKSLFDTARDEILAARVKAALAQGVRVGDDRAQQYYGAHRKDLTTQEVRLQIIVVKDEATANDIMRKLARGDNFGAVARQRSIGLRSAKGGDTDWVDLDALSPPLRDAVRTMKARQARGPIRSGTEFLIVRLDGRRPGRPMTLAEARPEIERRLLPAAQQEAVQQWLTAQRKTSKIDVLPTLK